MMPVCAVINCSRHDCVAERKKGFSFHLFPKKNLELRRVWEHNCFREHFKASAKSVICSAHFTKECFDRTGQTVRLKEGSVPTVICGLPCHLKVKFPSTLCPSQQKRWVMDCSKATIHESASSGWSLDTCDLSSADVSSQSSSASFTQSSGPSSSASCGKFFVEKCDSRSDSHDHSYALLESPGQLKKQLHLVYAANERLKKKMKILQQANRRLTKRNQSLTEAIADLRKKDLISSQFSEMFSQFDSVQTEIFKRAAGAKGQYTPQLKAFASTLYFYSPKAYSYVRKVFRLAMPHPAKIRQWNSKMEADHAYRACALDVLKSRAHSGRKMGWSLAGNAMDSMAVLSPKQDQL